jgi:glycosyltransferase involved in cell wall biosynthesis
VIERHTERRSILMFAYYFPPCVCWPTASMRAEGLATGLVQEGWDPIVVTRGCGCPCLDTGSAARGTDASLQRGVEVRRVDVHPSLVERVWIAARRWRRQGRLGRVGYRLVKPIRKARGLTEHRNDWQSRALAEGKALLRDRDVQALWTTSGPYLSIGIGRRLQRRHGLTWVADLRDSITRERDWADLIDRIAGHHLRRRWYRDLEKASAVVGVSPQEAQIDSEALGVPVHPLPSGFDLEAWESLRTTGAPPRARGDRFRVLYAGAFYGDRVELGGLVFRGLRRFVDTETGRPAISLVYIGRHGRYFLDEAAKQGCEDMAEDGGKVSPAEARRMMTQADLLLLLIPTTQDGGLPGGKLYEYLAAGPPILAVHGTDQYVMSILREARAGDGASTPEDISEVIARRFEEWRTGSAVQRPLDGLSNFTWSGRAHQLAALLEASAPQRTRGLSVSDPMVRSTST